MARVGLFFFRHKCQISPHSWNTASSREWHPVDTSQGMKHRPLGFYILTGANSLPISSFLQHLFFFHPSPLLLAVQFLSHSEKFPNELSQPAVSDTPFNLSLWCPRMINYLLEGLCVSQTSVLLNFLVLPLCCLRVHLLLIICR